MTVRSPTLTFLGGAGTVTGSKTLLETNRGRVLIDCGLFQGEKELRLRNWEPFPVDPASIDAVLITHAHLDHLGYLPLLARLGFAGPVFCTPGTEKLAGIVLPDSGRIHEEEARYANAKGFSKHDPALPLYTEEDASSCLRQMVAVPYDSPTRILDNLDATWTRAGHILGAAIVGLSINDRDFRVVFSGDLGRPTHPLLLPPAPIGDADVLLTESTYGDRRHDDENPENELESVIERVADREGVVVIPAFAVDRTEIVLWHLNRLLSEDRIPDLPVYVDSPMASRALKVYEEEALTGSPEIRPELRGIELFPRLAITEVRTVDESKALNEIQSRMIIISASGMATGGRVIHHLVHRIDDRRNAVVLVGFQAPGTRGEKLLRGVRELKMLGGYHAVRAEIDSVELSSHADQREILSWLTTAKQPSVVYINHGQPESSRVLAGLVRKALDVTTVVPRPSEKVRLP